MKKKWATITNKDERTNLPDVSLLRRQNLKLWFSNKIIPIEEKSYFSQLLNGKSSFGEKAARRIESKYEMPEFYLDKNISIDNETNLENSYKIKSLNLSLVCDSVLNNEIDNTIVSIEYTVEHGNKFFNGKSPDGINIITIQGDSMLGTLDPGDHVFVDVTVNEFKGDGIYVFILDNELYLKRLQSQRNKIAVISDNKAYDTWHLEGNERQDMRILAKVLLNQSIEYKKHINY